MFAVITDIHSNLEALEEMIQLRAQHAPEQPHQPKARRQRQGATPAEE